MKTIKRPRRNPRRRVLSHIQCERCSYCSEILPRLVRARGSISRRLYVPRVERFSIYLSFPPPRRHNFLASTPRRRACTGHVLEKTLRFFLTYRFSQSSRMFVVSLLHTCRTAAQRSMTFAVIGKIVAKIVLDKCDVNPTKAPRNVFLGHDALTAIDVRNAGWPRMTVFTGIVIN